MEILDFLNSLPMKLLCEQVEIYEKRSTAV